MTANVLGGEKRRSGFLAWAALLVLLPLSISNAFAQLRGHGGPVRALAIWSDGETAVSGSFDSTAIRWSLTRNAAVQVLRFHTDAVNAVVTLRDGRAAIFGDPDFYRPRRAGLGYAQGTVLCLNWVPPDTGKPLTVRPDQVAAGIAHPGATGGECDRARLLNDIEQY